VNSKVVGETVMLAAAITKLAVNKTANKTDVNVLMFIFVVTF